MDSPLTAQQLTVTGQRGLPASVRTVVFDFDDTLADTMDARIHAMRSALAAAAITDVTPEDFVVAERGVPLQVSLDSFRGGLGKELGLLDAYRSAYWTKKAGLLRMFDGVAGLVTALRGSAVPMGIVTSKARDIVVDGQKAGILLELAELGLDHLAPFTVGFEDVAEPKPHPEGLLRVLDWLGGRPEDTLVVGDSASDIKTAHNAGCWSCLAGWGVPADQRGLDGATPDFIAEHPSALLSLLLGARD